LATQRYRCEQRFRASGDDFIFYRSVSFALVVGNQESKKKGQGSDPSPCIEHQGIAEMMLASGDGSFFLRQKNEGRAVGFIPSARRIAE
jgi:hypothetical protein